MPYVEEELTIKTKIIGVASKIDENDLYKTRQVILEMIKDDPDIISILYLRQRDVWASLTNGNEVHLGNIKPKYEKLIMENVTQVISWEVTGGYYTTGEAIILAGTPTRTSRPTKTNFGMNIHIKLI